MATWPGRQPTMNPPLLTIHIPTIPTRTSTLSRTLHHLTQQPHHRTQTIITTGPDTYHNKHTTALQHATGRMYVTIDDDDWTPTDYTTTICNILEHHDIDMIGYHIAAIIDGHYTGTITHHHQGSPDWAHTLQRGPTPKTPIRTSIIRNIPFGDTYHADRQWAATITPHIKTGIFLDRHLYYHDYRSSDLNYDTPNDHDVGNWPFRPDLFTWITP